MLRFVIRTSTGEGDLETDTDGSLLETTAAAFDTVVAISLFTAAKATPDELERAGLTQRGYWFDAYDSDPALNTGSKLWLLEGRTLDAAALNEAKAYCDEALAWMVAEGAARQVDNVLERIGDDAFAGTTTIYRPGEESPYVIAWEARLAV